MKEGIKVLIWFSILMVIYSQNVSYYFPYVLQTNVKITKTCSVRSKLSSYCVSVLKHCNETFNRLHQTILREARCLFPVETVIRLPKGSLGETLIPDMIVVKRCTGLCRRYQDLPCAATAFSTRYIYVYVHSATTNTTTCKSFTVIEHTHCECPNKFTQQ